MYLVYKGGGNHFVDEVKKTLFLCWMENFSEVWKVLFIQEGFFPLQKIVKKGLIVILGKFVMHRIFSITIPESLI